MIRAVNEILNRGSNAEIRRTKDHIRVFEIQRKAKYSIPVNGQE